MRGVLRDALVRPWLPAALLIGATLAPACGPELDSCEAHRTCPTTVTGGGAGVGGTTDSAGSPGNAGGGNVAGNDDAGGASAGGASAGGMSVGGAGEGGEGGSTEPCSKEGVVECAGAASPFVRTCTGGVWHQERCEDGSLCDSLDRSCKPIIEGCVDRAAGDAFCEDVDKRRVCGPDLVTTTDQVCEGACMAGSCRKPACGDSKLEAGEACEDGNLAAGDGCSATCRAEPVAVELGRAFGCARLSDQRLKCWGDNSAGQLGLGDVLARGDAAGELGASLKEALRDVSLFAVGARHACAVSKSETWCWGDNGKYQLGNGSLLPAFSRVPLKVAVGATPVALAAGEDFTCALLADHSLRCWGSNAGNVFGVAATYLPAGAQAAWPSLALGATAKSIAAGASLCAIGSPGLICSGVRFPSAAYTLKLGVGFVVAGVSSGTSHDCAWNAAGDVKCWGGAVGPLGLDGQASAVEILTTTSLVPLGEPVSALDVGDDSTCAIVGDGGVQCWGSTQTGVLGRADLGATVGTTAYLGDETGEMAQLEPLDLGEHGEARAVAVGKGFACALLRRGALKCWGNNASGQLGHGNTETSGDDAGEMGAALVDTELD
jgi:cysteine-rich repeat protein